MHYYIGLVIFAHYSGAKILFSATFDRNTKYFKKLYRILLRNVDGYGICKIIRVRILVYSTQLHRLGYHICYQNIYFTLLGRISSIVPSLTITTQAIITLQAPTIADTFGMVLKKRV